jgi:branched-chain amino acid transport system ATP-binding protein
LAADGHERSIAPLFELQGVLVDFGGIRALDEVALTVAPGEVRGIIGPNGAGKTTLFDVISGVRRPDAGSVHLDGEDITLASSTRRAHLGIRRTFQRVQPFGWLTVEDNVLAALEWRGGGGGFVGDVVGWPGRRRKERTRRTAVVEVLDQCGLLELRNELAASLPIGIARMVELARAIVDEPGLLLLDEPASGLDEVESARLGAQIQRVRRDLGCAVLLVEHNAAFVMDQCEVVTVLDQGRVLAEGTPAEIQRSSLVRDAYLGVEAV